MRRREFIAACAGAMIVRSVAVQAQAASLPIVGWLHSGSAQTNAGMVKAFSQGLRDTGFVEGQNVIIEYRWGEGHYDRLSALVTDLIAEHVSAIFVTGSALPAKVAKAATSTIPIVFLNGGDPVKDGLVTSMSRPKGNLTGMTFLSTVVGTKRLQLLIELVQPAARLAILYNPQGTTSVAEKDDLQTAARSRGLSVGLYEASADEAIDKVFAALARDPPDGLCIATDTLFTSNRDHLVTLVARQRIPTIYPLREFVLSGGLMSYGTDLNGLARESGVYVGRILHGAKVADLPVVQPTTFDLVINLKTAKELGLTIPQPLLAQADELIE
jgi:putative tryptophan/tyrosine transport system substrate-binding protein